LTSARCDHRKSSLLSLGSSNSVDSHRFRHINLTDVDDLVTHLSSYRPSLRADIQNLTPTLYSLIEDRPLPDQKLCLEMLIKSQIASGEELFKFTDECSYFIGEAVPVFINLVLKVPLRR
jgi:hypothetical protein